MAFFAGGLDTLLAGRAFRIEVDHFDLAAELAEDIAHRLQGVLHRRMRHGDDLDGRLGVEGFGRFGDERQRRGRAEREDVSTCGH